MPTIKDVAREAGVSIATVSYVLNQRDDMVGEQTRQHVLQIAQKLGYKPNIVARNLQSSSTSLLGYAWHKHPEDQPNLVMDQFIYHLAHAAEQLGYHLLTFTHPSDNPTSVYQDLIASRRVDGFILANTQLDDPRIHFLMKSGVPFVSFGRANPSWSFNWVDTDGQDGTRQATEYLLSLGHRRIAFLGWPRDSLTGNYRLDGYLCALQRAEITVDEDFIIRNDYKNHSIDKAFDRWLSRPQAQQPTAILAVSDFVAVAAMRAAEQRGLQVGHQLSIIGFDDAPFVRYLKPGLTTLRQPFAEITRCLVDQLHCMIRGEGVARLERLFSPQLILRDSTGPAPR
ncbi:MAG: LacI family DNA-binding transcriptional regulator [Anaerolineae bacterium]|nr:LacI family DNA-binding transcriptional regulator [Anaerolineae bacterium]MDW8171667.1 LacI family DNA-binding transcriptional regulator [Anaerolineae bacterium]